MDVLSRWNTHVINVHMYTKSIYILRPRRNGRHFQTTFSNAFFLNENVWISIKTSLKVVHKSLINNIPTLDQIMALRRPGDKPLLNQCWLVYCRIYASLSLNELMILRPNGAGISEQGHQWLKQMLGALSVPSHYLNQCCLISWRAHGNTFQWNLTWNITFVQGNN